MISHFRVAVAYLSFEFPTPREAAAISFTFAAITTVPGDIAIDTQMDITATALEHTFDHTQIEKVKNEILNCYAEFRTSKLDLLVVFISGLRTVHFKLYRNGIEIKISQQFLNRLANAIGIRTSFGLKWFSDHVALRSAEEIANVYNIYSEMCDFSCENDPHLEYGISPQIYQSIVDFYDMLDISSPDDAKLLCQIHSIQLLFDKIRLVIDSINPYLYA